MPNYTYKGPVRDNLAAKKKEGHTGWMVPIADLRGAIDSYLKDLGPDDKEYQHVVFSVHKEPDKEKQHEQPERLYILGVVKEDVDAPTTANSPRPPGEFDDFPPWPP